MIRFEKVSFEQFSKDYRGLVSENISPKRIREIYDSIKLPVRATVGSAGYDFFSPIDFYIKKPGELLTLPTGVRFVTDRDDVVLLMVPRSGLGFKTGMYLGNTIGVIDSDYQNAHNEGHIVVQFAHKRGSLERKAGSAFCQGIILPVLFTSDDELQRVGSGAGKAMRRTGGFGSTDANPVDEYSSVSVCCGEKCVYKFLK